MITKQYIAGFFDGEGCVYVRRHKRWKGRYSTANAMPYDVAVSVTISNTNKKPLIMIKNLYGGSIQKQPKRGNRQDCYVCAIAARKALKFMCDILPYSIIKANKLEKAIFIQERIIKNSCKFIKGMRGSYVSPNEWNLRNIMVDWFKDNNIGIEVFKEKVHSFTLINKS